jgi:hypothetical protein
MTTGTDLLLVVDDTRPPSPGTDQVVIDDSMVWLLKFAPGVQQGVTVASNTFTLYLPNGASAGTSWSLSLLADDIPWSEITGANLPATTGTAVTTGVLGVIAAGGSVEFDIQPLAQLIASGTVDDLGYQITRLDGGAAVAVGTFRSALYAPLNEPVPANPPVTPTSPSPAGGRAVSVSTPLLRFKDYTVGSGNAGIQAMRVLWFGSLANALALTNVLSDDTLAVSSPEFDMASLVRTTAADGNTTNGSPTVTSATGAFATLDEGTAISGANIPAGARILTRNSSTSVTMTVNATGTATTTVLTVGGVATSKASTGHGRPSLTPPRRATRRWVS